MGGITGWDKGIGTLLGWWLRDQSQKKQEETLRQLLEDQRRQATNTGIGAGLQQGPIEPPGVRTPAATSPGFLESLTQIPGDIFQGATGGPPELPLLKEQYLQGAKDLERQQTLADAITRYQQTVGTKKPPLKEQLLGAWLQQDPQGAFEAYKQSFTHPLGIGNVAAEALQNMPGGPEAYVNKLIAPTPGPQPTTMEQLKASMTPMQWNEYIQRQASGAPKAPPRPIPFDTGTSSQLLDPTTLQPIKEVKKERPIPTGETDKIEAIRNLQDELSYVRDQFTTTEGAYVGTVRGRLGAAKETLGVLGGAESGFLRAAGNIKDTLARMRSGGQISPEEYTRLLKLAPNPATGAEQFMGNLVDFQRELGNVQKNKIETLKGAGYNVGGLQIPKSAGIVGTPGAPPAAAPTVGAPTPPTGQGKTWVRDPATGQLRLVQ